MRVWGSSILLLTVMMLQPIMIAANTEKTPTVTKGFEDKNQKNQSLYQIQDEKNIQTLKDILASPDHSNINHTFVNSTAFKYSAKSKRDIREMYDTSPGIEVLPGLLDLDDGSYGPELGLGLIYVSKKIKKAFKRATDINQIVTAYANHRAKQVHIPKEDYDRYNNLVMTTNSNDAWFNFEYPILQIDQVDEEMTDLIRSIIDRKMPLRSINKLIRQVKLCKDGGVMVFFKSPYKVAPSKKRLVVDLRVFAASCSNPDMIQLLIFHARKIGYFRDPTTSLRLRKFAKKIARRWLSIFFLARFSRTSKKDKHLTNEELIESMSNSDEI